MSLLAVTIAKAAEPSDLYFKSHKPLVVDLVSEHMNARSSSPVSKDVATMVAEYVIGERDIFGRDAWLRHWECDVVDPERALDPFEYTRFWFGPDPIQLGKQVCDTHIPPVLRPRVITHIPTGISYHYSLNVHGQLIPNPKEGYPSRYYNNDSKALLQNGRTKAGPACWLTMREDGVLARNNSWTQQRQAIRDINKMTGIRYEEEPSALDLVTVPSAHQVVTGKRCLGDDTGTEGRWTFSRSRDTVRDGDKTYRVAVGGNSSLDVEGGAPAGWRVASVDHFYVNVRLGLAGLRKD